MKWRRASFVLVVACAAVAPVCVAQCASPQWFAANAYPGVNGGYVNASTTWDPDGPGPAAPVLVAGGNFTTAFMEDVVFWDGTSWHGLGAGPAPGLSSGEVLALTVFNGELIAGGTFSLSGVARWDGTAWQPMGSSGPHAVQAFAVYNGELYAGRGTAVSPVSKWDGTSWQLVPGSGLASVLALAVHNGLLVAAGPAGSAVAAWNGTTWASLGTAMDGAVRALAVHNGSLIAGGDFTTAGGVPANRVARWTGSAWQALGAGLPAPVLALDVWNGDLVAATFTTTSGTVGVITKWDGALWQTLGSTAGGTRVRSLASFGGELYALGEFDIIGGITANRAARWNGVSWSRAGVGFNYEILTLATHGSELIAGGTFTVAGTVEAQGSARFDGATWHALGLGGSQGATVGAFASWNGNLVAGGSFIQSGAGGSSLNVASWDGTSWHAMGAGLNGVGTVQLTEQPSRIVRALAVYNGEVIAGGYFTSTAGGILVNSIARWNGSSWQPLGSGTNGAVHALCVYNGELYAGGLFTSAGGVPVSNVARWNGSVWQAAGIGPSAVVHALVTYGPDLIAGGAFTSVGGGPAQSVARWDGMTWSPLGLPGNNGVRALATFEGDLVASSTLWALPTGFTPGIARWTGATWEALGSGLSIVNVSFATGVRTLAAWRGSLFAAGTTTGSGTIDSPGLARWARPLPMLAVTQPGSGSVRLDDSWLLPNHEYYNVASLDLCAGGAGSGPYGGLCASDPAVLLQQILLPIGTLPFHFTAGGTAAAFGPFSLPPGLAFEAIALDATGGVVGCISTTTRHTVY